MAELDIVRLHTGLQLEYGFRAKFLRNRPASSETYLLSPNGLPLRVSWFDNHIGFLANTSVYTITTHPEQPTDMHHRIVLNNGSDSSVITLVEEESSDYVEGFADCPFIHRRERFGQPQIDRIIRNTVMGAYVLSASAGNSHAEFVSTHAYEVESVRDHGLAIINAGNVSGVIDDDRLNRYAQIDSPLTQ